MIKFLRCKESGQVYREPVAGWIPGPLEGVESTEGDDQQREFCRKFHACETLEVIHIFALAEEGKLFETLVYFTINSERVPVIIIKIRERYDEAPCYKHYRSLSETPLNMPLALLRM